MLLQNAGYKGVYVNKILAKGYATTEIDSFIKQRKRWATGCIQLAKKYNIFKQKGLNIKQKLEYLSCVSYWLFGIKIITYLLAPALFSIFNIVVIKGSVNFFLAMWFPQFILKRFVLDKIFDNYRSATWNKIYDTILFPPIFVATLKELLGIKKIKFEVSEKKKLNKKKISKNVILLFVTHLVFLIVNIISYCKAIEDIKINLLPFIWSILNILNLSIAIIFDITDRSGNIDVNKDDKVTDIKYTKKSIYHVFFEF